MKTKKATNLNHLLSGFIIVIITILTVRFIQWNSWKIERAVRLAGGIIRAAPAVNLTVWGEGGPLYKKSFSYNGAGHFYLINDFDIAPYYVDKRRGLKFTVNNREIGPLQLYRFKTYSVLSDGSRYFIFSPRKGSRLDFFRLKDSIPSIEELQFTSMVQLCLRFFGWGDGDGNIVNGLLPGFIGFEYINNKMNIKNKDK